MALTVGQVRLLQTNLNERLRARGRHGIHVDGKYGPETRNAVHLVKYLLGFPLSSLDTGPTRWFRVVVAHPSRRPPSYRLRARSRQGYLDAHVSTVTGVEGAFAVDWAWGTPNIPAMKAAGVKLACRYLSRDKSKNLTRAQAAALTQAGIAVLVVWETTANRAAAGYTAGVQDAKEALAQAKACGMPGGRPIYFAVDFDAQMPQTRPYFQGVASVLGIAGTGAYGSYRIVHGLFAERRIAFGWQTYAWSAGMWEQGAQLQQYSNGHRLAGVSCDFDRCMAEDVGQWTVA